MKVWQDILKDVLENGELRNDRTGTGTLALFNKTLEFDNEFTFPAVTTKKLAFKTMAAELACFLQGKSTLEDFHKLNCKIWDGNGNADYWTKNPNNTDPGNSLGRIYGARWRKWRVSDFREQPIPKLKDGIKPTFLGIANGHGSYNHPLKKTWEGMITRCYNPLSNSYKYYGGKGVYVANEWLEFNKFAVDAENLPGWDNKKNSTKSFDYQLDKDKMGNGFRYGPNTCCWLSAEENNHFKDKIEYTVQNISSGELFTFTNPSQFCLEKNIEGKNFCHLWTKKAKSRSGYRLFSIIEKENAKKYYDQLQNLVINLKKEPHGRRHIVSWWDPTEDIESSLPPCHYAFQVFIRRHSHVDIAVQMRSVDLFLGLPFDVASYALLQRLLAKELGLTSGKLYFNLGDTHIYLNHIEQVKTILERTPHFPPKLLLAEDASLFNFHPVQATLLEYNSFETLSAPMSV